MQYSLIANSGIQLLTIPIEIDANSRYRKDFLEQNDRIQGIYSLELLQQRQQDHMSVYYRRRELLSGGLIDPQTREIDWEGVDEERLQPIMDEGLLSEGLLSLGFGSKSYDFSIYENKWLPLPYFRVRGSNGVDFNAFNWVRAKFIPHTGAAGKQCYTVLLAIDTHSVQTRDESRECPAFEAAHDSELLFRLCQREDLLMDYCSIGHPDCGYIEEYLRSLAHPGVHGIERIRGRRKFAYLANYILMVHYLAEHNLLPEIRLYRDYNVESRDVDMIVDIGNSCTTAILSEQSDESPFSRLSVLELQDLTQPLQKTGEGYQLRRYTEPFDMRVAFRRADFGSIGYRDSRQFAYPSLVRLGREALDLTAMSQRLGSRNLSTCSSPKRYLWDSKQSRDEWEFITLEGEGAQGAVLELPGVTDFLLDDGRVSVVEGQCGWRQRYSRRSLMTFALLEMLQQARMQINSPSYRACYGVEEQPRRLRRLLLTCPTTMSAEERQALVLCAREAVRLYLRNDPHNRGGIEVLPNYSPRDDEEPMWYYDEATCAQLVYLYSELGYKYRGSAEEFLKLYGHPHPETRAQELTIGSIDIGAGTSDLMICNYTIGQQGGEAIVPRPLFYDSFYTAGDDMLYQLIRELLLHAPTATLRNAYVPREGYSYEQMLRDCCGPDYNGQSIRARQLRRDLNLQVFVPIMYHFLDLYCRGGESADISYEQLFVHRQPSSEVQEYFRNYVGVELKTLSWHYDRAGLENTVSKFFEPLINKVSAIMYAHSCDVILLSGRPTSLDPLRDLFLRFYPVAPNRLIRLNSHHVGDWYPFGKNTGYIKNPKTIIAVGAMIGFYGSEMARLERFALDTRQLANQVTSSMNYIEEPRQDNLGIRYCFTPDQHQGRATIYYLPCAMKVRKVDFPTYPSRPLFRIDYNDAVLERRMRASLAAQGQVPADGQVWEAVAREKERLRRLMPMEVELSRDPSDLEHLVVEAITDRHGNELNPSDFELTVQSLGVDENYWLDTGVFYN